MLARARGTGTSPLIRHGPADPPWSRSSGTRTVTALDSATMKAPPDGRKILARNRKALHEYHIEQTWETGIVLAGPEVKSVRAGQVSLAEAFASVEGGEVWLRDMH